MSMVNWKQHFRELYDENETGNTKTTDKKQSNAENVEEFTD